MKIYRMAAGAALAFALMSGKPAMADDWPFEPGQYIEVAMITVDDGHDLDYAKFLANTWRKSQEFAKSKGWISSYEVDWNVYKRPGEPDYYLITRTAALPDAAEQQKRNDAYTAYMKMTDAQLQAASGDRATYRHVMGSTLLQEAVFKDQ